MHKELDVCGSREALVTSLRPLQRLRIILLIALEQIYVGGEEERHIQLLRYVYLVYHVVKNFHFSSKFTRSYETNTDFFHIVSGRNIIELSYSNKDCKLVAIK